MKMDVLIIEPSKDLSALVAEAFARRELIAQVATTAEAGIKLADKSPPRAVILELLIPRHNGLEFIHEFRSYPDWLNVPIIIYSHLSKEELSLSKPIMDDMGIVAHFYKPTTSLKELVANVEEALA